MRAGQRRRLSVRVLHSCRRLVTDRDLVPADPPGRSDGALRQRGLSLGPRPPSAVTNATSSTTTPSHKHWKGSGERNTCKPRLGYFFWWSMSLFCPPLLAPESRGLGQRLEGDYRGFLVSAWMTDGAGDGL